MNRNYEAGPFNATLGLFPFKIRIKTQAVNNSVAIYHQVVEKRRFTGGLQHFQ
ncbi:MAG: hypothetical protein WAN36_13215 [Calditrichia bacterium]